MLTLAHCLDALATAADLERRARMRRWSASLKRLAATLI
jgi:hypothetical protein